MQKSILITGGTGLIGSHLSQKLIERGYKVSFLSRNEDLDAEIPAFKWDIERHYIDPKAFEGVSAIIHLAGTNIGEHTWTKQRKQEILNSRVKSSELLYYFLSNHHHQIESFVGASAIGYYGNTGSVELTEDMPAGFDFLAITCKHWEHAVKKISELKIRTVNIRAGSVLTPKGGLLEPIVKTVKYFVGATMGPGTQYLSWIHIDDLCAIYIKALEDKEMAGPYNAVSMNPVTNKELIKSVGKILHKPIWLPNIPSIILKLILGERADLLLNSNYASNEKLIKTGFEFQHTELEEALRSLLAITREEKKSIATSV